MKKLVTAPLTRNIYYATVNEQKGIITGEKKDVTDNAIECVLDHFILDGKFKENGFSGYVYGKKDGGNLTICAFDDSHVCVTKKIYDELREYKAMYEALCK